MSDFKSKFKGAKVSTIKDARKEAESKSRFFGKGYTEFHTIKEGMNLFRIAPPHEEDSPSFRPIRSTYLECEVDKLDSEGNPTGEKEVKNKRIFISTVHGENMPKDIIETYINYVRDRAENEFPNKEQKDDKGKFLAPITGWKDKKQEWHPGIEPSTNYVFYAWDRDWKLGRLELYNTDLTKMENLNIDEGSGELMETDVFSDPEEGVWLTINRKKNDKGKWERILGKKIFNPQGLKSSEVASAYEKFMEEQRVPEEKLKEFSEKDSLKQIYCGVYSKRDFMFALDGIRRFDEKNGFSIFDDENFLTELTEIMSFFEDESETNDSDSNQGNDTKETKITESKKVEEPKKTVVKEDPKPKEEVAENFPPQTTEKPKTAIDPKVQAQIDKLKNGMRNNGKS